MLTTKKIRVLSLTIDLKECEFYVDNTLSLESRRLCNNFG